MVALQLLARFIIMLRCASSPVQIAAGFTLGMTAGLVPSLHLKLILIVIVIFLNVNLASAIIGIAIFSAVAYLLDSLFYALGCAVFDYADFLIPLWTVFYNTPSVPFTRFNNMVAVGSFVVSLALFMPVFGFTRWGIIVYRNRYEPMISKLRVIRKVRKSELCSWYKFLKRLADEV